MDYTDVYEFKIGRNDCKISLEVKLCENLTLSGSVF